MTIFFSFIYLQSMPVAASTICLLMLSLDRYATVKHPRLAQLRQKRYLPIILAISAWLSASILCIPILLAYNIKLAHNLNAGHDMKMKNFLCEPDYGSSEYHVSFVIVHTLCVFIFPALGVILNHLVVRRRLCALSLRARAAHGELPLPMPLLRRPTHMIIVTGMANAARGVGVGDSSDEDQAIASERNLIVETKMRATPRTPR